MVGLRTSTETLDEGTYVVSVTGELDLSTGPSLERELAAVLGNDAEVVIVDLKSDLITFLRLDDASDAAAWRPVTKEK